MQLCSSASWNTLAYIMHANIHTDKHVRPCRHAQQYGPTPHTYIHVCIYTYIYTYIYTHILQPCRSASACATMWIHSTWAWRAAYSSMGLSKESLPIDKKRMREFSAQKFWRQEEWFLLRKQRGKEDTRRGNFGFENVRARNQSRTPTSTHN
jgi:hypothetical protein